MMSSPVLWPLAVLAMSIGWLAAWLLVGRLMDRFGRSAAMGVPDDAAWEEM